MGQRWQIHRRTHMMRPTLCIIRPLCLYLLIKGQSLAGTSVVDIAFHPSEPIAVWNGDYSVIVHSMNDSSSERKIHIDPIKTGMFRIHGLTFHPSGKYLALAGGSPGTKGSVLVLNWPDWGTAKSLPPPNSPKENIFFLNSLSIWRDGWKSPK